MVDVVVAGQISLDILPNLSDVSANHVITPGGAFEIGALEIAVGGGVPNTGLALHQLGADVRLISVIGDDMTGKNILSLLREYDTRISQSIRIDQGAASPYTLLLSPQNNDRTILHFFGTNGSFCADDIDYDLVASSRIFHLAYPPLLPGLLHDDGQPLVDIFRRVKDLGVVTSLDSAMPDPTKLSGQVNWRKILKRVLPYVDIFVPSIEEITFMLHRGEYEAANGNVLPTLTYDSLQDRANELLNMGCILTGFKLSHLGLFLQGTDNDARRIDMDRLPVSFEQWTASSVYHPTFKADVVGTTGAGDATYAAILNGLLLGLDPEATTKMACAVGALNVQRADAVSGLLSWEATREKVAQGWQVQNNFLPS